MNIVTFLILFQVLFFAFKVSKFLFAMITL